MARLPIIDRKDMNAEQARVYDAAQAAGSVVGGPYYVYIRQPALFEAAQQMRQTLGAAPLSPRERQIVNMTIARFWGAEYPWGVQARASLNMGISRAVVDAINAGRAPDLPDARERMCYTVAREMLTNKGLSDALYRDAEKLFGQDQLIALVATVGSFTMTCLTTATFQVAPPADIPVPLAR
jgi:4-carboxymuconolactone decarboxylase